jgi:hypothetical protein
MTFIFSFRVASLRFPDLSKAWLGNTRGAVLRVRDVKLDALVVTLFVVSSLFPAGVHR